jgi:hypothetical protein
VIDKKFYGEEHPNIKQIIENIQQTKAEKEKRKKES